MKTDYPTNLDILLDVPVGVTVELGACHLPMRDVLNLNEVDAHSDGNEVTSPNTAEVWAEHSVWPQDPGFVTALAGGITSLQILPGSGNLFGGVVRASQRSDLSAHAQLFGGLQRGGVVVAVQLATKLILEEARVSVVTGKAFGDDKCLRLSYANSEENLKTAASRIHLRQWKERGERNFAARCRR